MTERVTGDSAMHPQFIQITPEQCLEKLRDASLSSAERWQYIVEAEALRFAGDEAMHVSALLREYIELHRDSSDLEHILAVGSAIRKYAGTMHAADLPVLGAILEPGDRAPVSQAIELEVVKMIVRKLVANPPAKVDPYRELSGRLAELAATYLKDGCLAQERHGAIALNAVLSLALLGSDKLEGVVQTIRGLGSTWFRELVLRRASQTHEALHGRQGANTTVCGLERLLSELGGQSEL